MIAMSSKSPEPPETMGAPSSKSLTPGEAIGWYSACEETTASLVSALLTD